MDESLESANTIFLIEIFGWSMTEKNYQQLPFTVHIQLFVSKNGIYKINVTCHRVLQCIGRAIYI